MAPDRERNDEDYYHDSATRILRLEVWRAATAVTLETIFRRQLEHESRLQTLDGDVRKLSTADEIANAVNAKLEANESRGWTKRERVLGLLAGVTAIGSFALNIYFAFGGTK